MRLTDSLPAVADLPDGVVTFLFTDVEGSTQLWEEAPETMMSALRQHDEVIDQSVATYRGLSVKPRGEGDSRFVVFPDAVDAVAAAAAIQLGLDSVEWVTPRPLRVRASLHTGKADLQMGDYYGQAVNRAARLRAIAHGGQTVISRPTWELIQDSLPNGVDVRDMGLHRLKDLTRPEHVFQLDIAGLDRSFPPLASLDAVPNNLPEQLTEFVGRQAELEQAEALLHETRLLTILAPGGAGKTRLAIQAAADAIGNYPDGVFFVPLADISSANDIVQTAAESLGLGLSSDKDPLAQLLANMATKERLLVFDNFEHVADGAAIVSEILRSSPLVRVIVTSRTRLNITGETILSLGGLETTWETTDQAMHVSGVRLFVDAARRSQPRLSIGLDDLGSLALILELTGGMPLAIILAAAWADMLSVAEIAAEVERNIEFLETELGDVPARQRSIRAVFDYSWRLLAEEERSTFAALSVFRGGFTREAAGAVAGASLRSLASLANKSFLSPNPDTGRYTVHELLRQFGETELQGDPALAKRVLDARDSFYAELAGQVGGRVHLGDDLRAVEIFENDIDNLRAAWQRAVEERDATTLRALILPMWFLYEIRGWYRAALALFGPATEALAPATDEPGVVAYSLARAVQGWFLAVLGRQEEGGVEARAAVKTLDSYGDREARWLAHHCLGVCLLYEGKHVELFDNAAAGLEEAEHLEGPSSKAFLLNWRSLSKILTGDLEAARALLDGMEEYRRTGDHYFLSWHLMQQSMLASADGRLADAVEKSTRSVERAETIGYWRVVHVALTQLAEAQLATGDADAAEASFIKALAVAEQMSMVREMLLTLTWVATIRAGRGEHEDAVGILSSVLAESSSAQHGIFDTESIRDAAGAALGDLEDAMEASVFEESRRSGENHPYDGLVKRILEEQALARQATQ